LIPPLGAPAFLIGKTLEDDSKKEIIFRIGMRESHWHFESESSGNDANRKEGVELKGNCY
jgi:hypothetical protein